MAWTSGPSWRQLGCAPPDAQGLFAYRPEATSSQDSVSVPHPGFLGCLPSLESHLKESRTAICVWHFSMLATEKQNQSEGLFNCNMKNHAFSREKRRVLHPYGFQRNTTSADSVPFKPKQAHLSSQKVPFKRMLSTGLYFTSNVPKPN